MPDCRLGRQGILDWWCTEHPDAFSADEPVYVTMEAELRRVCGAAVHDELAAYCQARQNGEPRSLTLLPVIPLRHQSRHLTSGTPGRGGCRLELGLPVAAPEVLTGRRRLGLGSWPAPRLTAAIGRFASVLAVGCAESRSCLQ